nr:hypothetical protein [Tanacetum cinerariifolium]
ELVPILSENEVTLEDKRECDVPIFENSPICNDHSEIFSDSKNDDDISVYDDFEDIEYIEASLSDPEIVSVEEENKRREVVTPLLMLLTLFLSMIRFALRLSPIRRGDIRFLEELLIDDTILSHESSDSNFEDNPSVSLPPPEPPDAEFDAGKEIPVAMNDKDEDDNPSVSLPPPEPPDAEFDAGKEIPVAMNDKDEDVDYSSFIFIIYPEMFPSLIFVESEDTIFDPGFFPSVIEVFLCWIFVSVSKIFISFL